LGFISGFLNNVDTSTVFVTELSQHKEDRRGCHTSSNGPILILILKPKAKQAGGK
jgi:hypothetical protein